MPTIAIFLCIIVVFALLFIGLRSGAGRGESVEFSDLLPDQESMRKREEYLMLMKARLRKVKIVLLIFIIMVFSIPFFVVMYDTVTFSGKMDMESHEKRMRDIYIFLGSMIGLGLLFLMLVSWLMRNMTRNYKKVIVSLDKSGFEKMINVNQSMNMLDRFMMTPPFIMGQTGLYVFKFGRVLAFPWKDITAFKITGAPRNGFFVRMKVSGKMYLFSIADRSMMNILEVECLQQGIARLE